MEVTTVTHFGTPIWGSDCHAECFKTSKTLGRPKNFAMSTSKRDETCRILLTDTRKICVKTSKTLGRPKNFWMNTSKRDETCRILSTDTRNFCVKMSKTLVRPKNFSWTRANGTRGVAFFRPASGTRRSKLKCVTVVTSAAECRARRRNAPKVCNCHRF